MEGDWVRGACIGKGSFGTVSLACDKLEGRVFAVKSVPLNSSSVESLENEIEILRSLDSRYVVAYLGDSTTEGSRNLHMEYVPGGTLADAAGRLGEHQVRAYTWCIVQGLFYLHSVARVAHADVKGRNVLVGHAPGLAKLADFGSARRISDGRCAIGGTPLWMAPEVVRGEAPMPESDIWSLGCTVVEMITGAHPWKNSGGQDKLFEIGFGDGLPEFPAQLSKSGTDFLARCLRRNPAERWTAEQLLQHPFLEGAAEAADETGLSPRSILDWAGSEFNEDDEAEDSDDEGHVDHVVGLARERISQLAGGSESKDLDWDSEGWLVVRHFDREAEASGSGLSSDEEMRCSCCGSNCGSCCSCVGGQQVLFHVIFYLLNVNPKIFILVLQLFRVLYRFDELRFLNL